MKYIVKEVKLMDCLTCGTKMKCVDDINDIGTRIDWVVCPKCGSKATIHYDPLRGWKIKVEWDR